MLSETANIGSLSRFPWTLAPAAAIFLVVLSTNLLTTDHHLPRDH